MQSRKFFILMFLTLALLLVAVAVFWYSGRRSTLRAGDSDFSLDRSLEVLRLEILNTREGQGADMRKDPQGRWVLNEQYFADESAVAQIITALSRLQVRQPVSRENQQQVAQMLENDALEMRVWVRGYRIQVGGMQLLPYQRLYQSLRIGEDTPDAQSTYMRKQRSQRAFKVHIPGAEGGVAYLFEPHERSWRNPVVIDLEAHQISSVEVQVHQQPEQSYVLRQDRGGSFAFFAVESENPLLDFVPDTARVMRFLASFRDVHYDHLLNEQQEEERNNTIFGQPFMEITVESIAGLQVHVEAFYRSPGAEELALSPGLERDPNRLYVRVNQGEFAMARFFVFSRILRPVSFFRN